MICSIHGCPHDAIGGVSVIVPSEGGTLNPEACIQMVLGIALCQDHFVSIPAKSLIGACGEKLVALRCLERQLPPPDFNRCYILRQSFNSPDWLTAKNASSPPT